MLLIGLLHAPNIAAADPSTAAETKSGVVSGVVRNSKTNEALPNALVILQCSCLSGARETQTNARGLYAFRDLPPGTYTIQVLAGQADVSKVTTLPGGSKFRANFSLNPKSEFKRSIRVKASPVRMETSQSFSVSMDSAGISLAGTTGAESVYTTQGANLSGGGRPRPIPPKQRLQEMRAESMLIAAASPAATPEPVEVTVAKPAVETVVATEAGVDNLARQIVYSGQLQLSVFHAEEAVSEIEQYVVGAGGYVETLSPGKLQVRVPAAKFQEAMTFVGDLGRVDFRAIHAEDVTDDYYDLSTRIKVLRRTQTKLMSLLGQARSVKDALSIQTALDKVTLDLEKALGQERLMHSRVRYSALSIEVAERLRDTEPPSSNDPFPWVDSIGVESVEWR